MKRQLINEQSAISAILSSIPNNINQNDFRELDFYISLGIDWTETAMSISLTRQKLYHWYYDTFRKRYLPQMSESDKDILQDEVERGYQVNKISPQFKSKLFQKFGEYDYRVFSVAYTNCLRKCRRKCSGEVVAPQIKKSLSDTNK